MRWSRWSTSCRCSAAKMETDVIPILESLTSVAPDLHDLLDVSRELNEMLAKLPGMGAIKRRVDRGAGRCDPWAVG